LRGGDQSENAALGGILLCFPPCESAGHTPRLQGCGKSQQENGHDNPNAARTSVATPATAVANGTGGAISAKASEPSPALTTKSTVSPPNADSIARKRVTSALAAPAARSAPTPGTGSSNAPTRLTG